MLLAAPSLHAACWIVDAQASNLAAAERHDSHLPTFDLTIYLTYV